MVVSSSDAVIEKYDVGELLVLELDPMKLVMTKSVSSADKGLSSMLSGAYLSV